MDRSAAILGWLAVALAECHAPTEPLGTGGERVYGTTGRWICGGRVGYHAPCKQFRHPRYSTIVKTSRRPDASRTANF